MPVKKKEEPINSNANNNINNNINTNNNTNNNVNNNHVSVHVELSDPKSNIREKQEHKPNWVVKAIVLALIGLAVSIIGYYATNQSNQKHKPAVIENGAPAITGEKVN
jgi:hypothetical protein